MSSLGNQEYEAGVVLPYTSVLGRDPNEPDKWQMSFYTRRCAEAAALGYHQGLFKKILVPGEGDQTAFLVEDYLVSVKKVPAPVIKPFPFLDGTQQQLDPIADLQHQRKLGRVRIYGWAFHNPRAEEIKDRWGIEGDIAEVENEILNDEVMKGKTEVSFCDLAAIVGQREIWVNSPTYQALTRTEQQIPALLMTLDTPFGRFAPLARISKFIMGPTITDIDQITLLRLQAIKRLLSPKK